MTWWPKEPWHQQSWYWLTLPSKGKLVMFYKQKCILWHMHMLFCLWNEFILCDIYDFDLPQYRWNLVSVRKFCTLNSMCPLSLTCWWYIADQDPCSFPFMSSVIVPLGPFPAFKPNNNMVFFCCFFFIFLFLWVTRYYRPYGDSMVSTISGITQVILLKLAWMDAFHETTQSQISRQMTLVWSVNTGILWWGWQVITLNWANLTRAWPGGMMFTRAWLAGGSSHYEDS